MRPSAASSSTCRAPRSEDGIQARFQTSAAILDRVASCLGRTIVLLLVVALVRPAAGIGAFGSDPGGRRMVTLGRSVEGRLIIAVETGDLDARRRALIVGCIHGNETAGIAIAD